MHKLIGGTPAQFRTCKAHCLARSIGRPKSRYTGSICGGLIICDTNRIRDASIAARLASHRDVMSTVKLPPLHSGSSVYVFLACVIVFCMV